MIVVDIVLSHSQKYCIHMKTEMSPLLVKGCNIGFSSVVMAFMKGGLVIVLHLCSVECPPMEQLNLMSLFVLYIYIYQGLATLCRHGVESSVLPWQKESTFNLLL